MGISNEVRIDKFLWSVRLFKTRSIATEACRKGRVLIGGLPVKPSRNVAAGEIIALRRMPVIFSYKVIEPISSRVSAKLVPNYIEDLTPEVEKEKLLAARSPGLFGFRTRGSGRPTKKERRVIDDLLDEIQDW
ncbi:MAG TPA: RNA-binding S4 domain-containing protein [Bacteroidales bacterium]|nr:RNA-binding S4 domain-containing protein [Bacteroidales bacterium]